MGLSHRTPTVLAWGLSAGSPFLYAGPTQGKFPRLNPQEISSHSPPRENGNPGSWEDGDGKSNRERWA